MSVTSAKEIAWVAGLLEGEGYFGWHDAPRIALAMTDSDVVEHFKQVTQTPNRIFVGVYSGRKPMYRVSLCGSLAIQWMLTLYSLLGDRRRERIRNVIAQWKSHTPRVNIRIGDYCKHGHLIKGFNVRRYGTSQSGAPYIDCKICSISVGPSQHRWGIAYRNRLIARHIAELGPVREDPLNADAIEQAKEDAIKALERLGISHRVAEETLREAQGGK